MGKLNSVTIDCKNAQKLAGFWVQALDGYSVDPQWDMVLKSDAGPTIYFQTVPEPKKTKNRVHLDLSSGDRPSEVERLKVLGAKVQREMEEGGFRWTVMQDPEGNEFCVTQASA